MSRKGHKNGERQTPRTSDRNGQSEEARHGHLQRQIWKAAR